MIHELKTLSKYYIECVKGTKTFELRKDDRNFNTNDILILKEWEADEYTGKLSKFTVTYVLKDAKQFGLQNGFVILGIKPVN